MPPAQNETPESRTQPVRRRAPSDPRLTYRFERSVIGLVSKVCGWLGLALLMAGLFWWAGVGAFTRPALILWTAGVLGAAFYIAVNLRAILALARRRQFLLGLNSAVFSAFALGILVLLNIVIYRHPLVKDMTALRLYSLSEQTVSVIKSLDRDVQMLVFMDPEMMTQQRGRDLMQRFEEYARQSPRIKLEYKDPYVDIDLVRKYNVLTPQATQGLAPASVVLVSGERNDTVTGTEEADITTALLRITTKEKPKIYFLFGNGEVPLEGDGTTDMSGLKRALESQQYEVATLVLSQMAKPEVPADCKALVIAGATRPIPKPQMDAIARYADNQGKLLIGLRCDAPPGSPRGGDAPDFHEVLEKRGVTVLRGVVVDMQTMFRDKTIPAFLSPKGHPIVENLQLVALPYSCALRVTETPPPPSYPGAPPPPPQKVQPLFQTSQLSWLETEIDPKKIGATADKPRGPLTLAAVIDEGATSPDAAAPATRIAVFGSADFMVNRYNSDSLWGNLDMAAKTVAWLASRESLVSIPPKRDVPRFLTMTNRQKWLATIVCLFILPGVAIASGAVVWFMRRWR